MASCGGALPRYALTTISSGVILPVTVKSEGGDVKLEEPGPRSPGGSRRYSSASRFPARVELAGFFHSIFRATIGAPIFEGYKVFTNKVEQLRKSAAEAAGRARAIAEKADREGRELTADEVAEYRKSMAEGQDLLQRLKQAKADAGVWAELEGLGSPAGGRKRGGSGWAAKAGEAVRSSLVTEVGGQKALVTGTIGVPSPIETDVVRLPETARSILELVPAVPATGGGGFGAGNTFSFLQQVARTNNAAVVPDGGLKPTSVYTLEQVEDRFRVIAHLSEKLPERYLSDFANLEAFLRSEMEIGILEELEAQIVSGDGVGENLTGILSTSGVVQQAFATDVLTTLRKAVTTLETTGILKNAEVPALVMNPVDLEALDLLRDGGASGRFLLGDPAGDEASRLWRLPRVPSTGVAAGTAILGDFGQTEIVVREDMTLALDRSGDNFRTNQVEFRVEGRFGFAVKRPSALVVADLTAV